MLNTRAFIGGRVTNALNNVCEEVGVRAGIIREDVFESIRSTANPELNPPDFIMVNWWLWHYAAATVLNRRNIFCGPRPQKRFPYSVCKLKPFQI